MAEFRDEINCAKPRRSYLITYSQADLNKFPTRQSFAAAVCEVFTSERRKFRPQHGRVASRIMQMKASTIIWR